MRFSPRIPNRSGEARVEQVEKMLKGRRFQLVFNERQFTLELAWSTDWKESADHYSVLGQRCRYCPTAVWLDSRLLNDPYPREARAEVVELAGEGGFALAPFLHRPAANLCINERPWVSSVDSLKLTSLLFRHVKGAPEDILRHREASIPLLDQELFLPSGPVQDLLPHQNVLAVSLQETIANLELTREIEYFDNVTTQRCPVRSFGLACPRVSRYLSFLKDSAQSALLLVEDGVLLQPQPLAGVPPGTYAIMESEDLEWVRSTAAELAASLAVQESRTFSV